MQSNLDMLLDFVRSEGRVCPMPLEWNELWEMLPDKKRIGAGWEPAIPLILAAWDSPEMLKALRLEDHIRYAAAHGILNQVDQFLRSLHPEQWFYRR